MTLEEIEGVLARALKLRSPVFQDAEGAAKVSALEDFMLTSANVNGNLVEALYWVRQLEEKLADEVGGLAGWEVALKRPRAKASKVEINAAKLAVAPQLFAAGRKARGLRQGIEDQIGRLERAERAVSRAYSMATGS
jgi:hypothetical protein